MTLMAKVHCAPCTLRLFTDDAILAGFFAAAGVAAGKGHLEVVPTQGAAGRLSDLRAPDVVITDQAGFPAIAPYLSEVPGGIARILVAGRVDRELARRWLAAGGTAAIPTSYDKARFFAAFALAIAGEPVLPAELWLPCLHDRAFGAAPAGAIEAGLTPRETDVLGELATGKSNKQIAHRLGIAEPTVKMHLVHIGRKFGAANRTQLLARAVRMGLLPGLAGPAGTGAA